MVPLLTTNYHTYVVFYMKCKSENEYKNYEIQQWEVIVENE